MTLWFACVCLFQKLMLKMLIYRLNGTARFRGRPVDSWGTWEKARGGFRNSVRMLSRSSRKVCFLFFVRHVVRAFLHQNSCEFSRKQEGGKELKERTHVMAPVAFPPITASADV